MRLPALVFLVYLSLLVLGLGDNIRGPLFPELLREFGIGDTLGSLFFAMSSGCGALGAASCPWLFRRFSPSRVLSLSLIAFCLGLAGMGAAHALWSFLFSCAFFGWGIGLMGVCQNLLAAEGAPPGKRRQVLAGLHAMYGLASFCAPLLVAWAVPTFETWRAAFALTFLPAAALAWWSWRFQTPRAVAVAKNHDHGALRKGFFHEHGARIFIAISLSSYVVAEIMVSTRLALYLRREQMMSLESSSLAVSLFFLGMLVGRGLAAFVSWPWSSRTHLLGCLLASFLLMMAGLWGWTPGWVLTGLAMASFYPVCVSYISELFPQSLNAVLSLTLTLQSALVVSMHLGVGWLTEAVGIRWALCVGPAAVAVSFLILVFYESVFHHHAARV